LSSSNFAFFVSYFSSEGSSGEGMVDPDTTSSAAAASATT